MSRLISKLNQVSKAEPQPIGFGAKAPSSKPKLQLITTMVDFDANTLANRVAGADAGLLHIQKISAGAKAIQKFSQAVPDIPWGGWLEDSADSEIGQLLKAGCDFVVFPATYTPQKMLQNNEIGKILVIEPSLNDGLLRAINDLPIDAVLVASEQKGEYALTWNHLMLFCHFANLLTKPLLASVSPAITANELQALWDAGVSGILIGEKTEQPVDLSSLRRAIDGLTPVSRRKGGRLGVLLPNISSETDVIPEEEEPE